MSREFLTISERIWRDSIISRLKEYICIPNKSPNFDPAWEANGYMTDAAHLLLGWALEQKVSKRVQLLKLPHRTPVIYIEIPPTDDSGRTALLYGHYDKQPEASEWREGLDPWTPVIEGDHLYGRGGADDGYAIFASLAAAMCLEETGVPHSRLVILIEGSEESGSPDLPFYMEEYGDLIGTPDLVICLDSGCGNYDQVWGTTSLRGLVSGDLKVKLLEEEVHSGSGGGIVPDTALLAFGLVSRLFDSNGLCRSVAELDVDIPRDRLEQAAQVVDVLGDSISTAFPWVPGAGSIADNRRSLLRNTWSPSLAIIGVDGFPATLADAGNTLRPYTTLRLSIRVPPTLDADKASDLIKSALETNPPFGAEVTFTPLKAMSGWNAPSFAPWLETSINDASMEFFGKPMVCKGEGGSIAFMGMLGEKFPDAQFFITGVLGPGSNAHGPNEFLHIPMATKLTAVVAWVLEDFSSKS